MAKKKAKMPAKAKAKRSPEPDVNQLAHHLGKRSTEEAGPVLVPTDAEISRVMAELGRRGGKIGGNRRASALSPEKRREIALKAARSRWDKNR